MKKIKYLSLILCLMLIPMLSINAMDKTEEPKEETKEEVKKFNVVAGEDITTSSNVDGSSVVAGNNVVSENTVKGIDMVFGQTVTYNGNSDYSVIAAETISVNGITNNDGFIFGNIVTFNKDYIASRDLFVFANSVILRGEIKRDVTIYAASVILEDVTVNGNVTIYASDIEVKNATVSGKLSYDEEAVITISDEAVINEKDTVKSNSQTTTTNNILTNIVSYLSVLVLFAVIAIVLPGMFKKIENKTQDISVMKFISMLGYGLFFLIIIPVIAIFLLFTPITQLVGLLLLGIYILVICAYNIFAGYFIGLLIWKKFIKKDINMLLVGLLGISILTVLSFIPYINTISVLISMLLSLSIFVKLFTKDA